MADMTTVQAMQHATASATKTAILAAADAFDVALTNAQVAGELTSHQHAQTRSEFVDYLERLASELG